MNCCLQKYTTYQFIYSLWSTILATLHSISKIFPGEFRNRKKPHRPFLYSTSVLFMYVISLKVTVERRGRKKGPSLVYRFQRSMESGDTSDEEVSPCDPTSKNKKYKNIGQRRFLCLLTWKLKTASKDMLSWSSPKNWLGMCRPTLL